MCLREPRFNMLGGIYTKVVIVKMIHSGIDWKVRVTVCSGLVGSDSRRTSVDMRGAIRVQGGLG